MLTHGHVWFPLKYVLAITAAAAAEGSNDDDRYNDPTIVVAILVAIHCSQ